MCHCFRPESEITVGQEEARPPEDNTGQEEGEGAEVGEGVEAQQGDQLVPQALAKVSRGQPGFEAILQPSLKTNWRPQNCPKDCRQQEAEGLNIMKFYLTWNWG